MSIFIEDVLAKVKENATNLYTDNHDVDRFGPPVATSNGSALKRRLRRILFKNRVHRMEMDNFMHALAHLLRYESGLESLYANLKDEESRRLLVDLAAYKILGSEKFKLKTNTAENTAKLQQVRGLADSSEVIDPQFMHMLLHKFDLKPIGFDVQLFFNAYGVFIDFVLEQYRYRTSRIEIGAAPGDVVIDAGGCWGDTALYFADRVGDKGKVYSFEFIPGNIKIFNRNMDLNPRLKDRVQVVTNPLWNKSGIKTYYKDFGPGSSVSFEPFSDMTGQTETITIDDFVSRNQIQNVDFIKMDIEGAEGAALEGARKTIEQHKPKLAIAIYHNNEQFVDVPKWIQDLNLGYHLYLDHFTIHTEETVIYAQVP